MTTAYSPYDSHATAAASDSSRRQGRSPLFVSLPAQSAGYPYDERESETRPGSYTGGGERASYPGGAHERPYFVAAHYGRSAEDPYRRYPPSSLPYEYPPRPDYYGASAPPPPPPPADYYRPHAPPAPYRDPYSYPPRHSSDQSYSPRQATYPAYPPHVRSRESYPGRDHYTPTLASSYPPPDAPPPRADESDDITYDLGSHPDPNDLSIPLLYLARVISPKTITVLQPKFANLDLRFLHSLLDLSSELHAASTGPPESLGDKRRVWVTAIAGTEPLVPLLKVSTPEVLDWREVDDLQELERELADEDKRVAQVREKSGVEAMEQERGRSRTCDEEEIERERGRREIEELERKRRVGEAGGIKSGAVELDEVLRAVRGEGSGSSPAPDASTSPTILPWSDPAQMPPPPTQVIDFAAPAQQNSSASHVSEDAHSTDRTDSQSPCHARKRSRNDSDSVHDEEREKRRAMRRKLEAVCKMPRRNCALFAGEHGIPVNEETRLINAEPQLGERHRGNWNLFGQELDDVSPQIQVLMARAMRDVTYSPRLRLYDHPEALEMLQAAVPWFLTLLETVAIKIKHRYERAGAALVAPQHPPIGDTYTILPEGSTQIPTLRSLADSTKPHAAPEIESDAPSP